MTAGAAVKQSIAPFCDAAFVVEAATIGLELGRTSGLSSVARAPDGLDQDVGGRSGGIIRKIAFVDYLEDGDAVVEHLGFAEDGENGVLEFYAAVTANVEAGHLGDVQIGAPLKVDRIGVKRIVAFVDLPTVSVQMHDEVGTDAGAAGNTRRHYQLGDLSTFGELEAVYRNGDAVDGVRHGVAIACSEDRVLLQGIRGMRNTSSHGFSSFGKNTRTKNVPYFYYISKLLFCQYFRII